MKFHDQFGVIKTKGGIIMHPIKMVLARGFSFYEHLCEQERVVAVAEVGIGKKFHSKGYVFLVAEENKPPIFKCYFENIEMNSAVAHLISEQRNFFYRIYADPDATTEEIENGEYSYCFRKIGENKFKEYKQKLL